MLQGLADNAGTIIVCLVLIGLVTGIIIRLRKDKKQGKSSCGCNCGCCPMSGSCHKHS
ncbi:MAG: FeoB-associated Cys-rich membrane protein [Clostridia bacterium]|nr:FeoB-associated Cys-rich membrane protein [Clostridia bacterium]